MRSGRQTEKTWLTTFFGYIRIVPRYFYKQIDPINRKNNTSIPQHMVY